MAAAALPASTVSELKALGLASLFVGGGDAASTSRLFQRWFQRTALLYPTPEGPTSRSSLPACTTDARGREGSTLYAYALEAQRCSEGGGTTWSHGAALEALGERLLREIRAPPHARGTWELFASSPRSRSSFHFDQFEHIITFQLLGEKKWRIGNPNPSVQRPGYHFTYPLASRYVRACVRACVRVTASFSLISTALF